MKKLLGVFIWLALLILITGLTVGCAGGPTEVTPAPTTPGPTVTPTPAPPGPTPTPAPTPQEGQAKFEIVDSDMFLISRRPDNELRIVGVVKNTGDGLGYPYGVFLVDASGKVVAQPRPTWLRYIEPGQKSPFCARWYGGMIPQGWQDLEVRLTPPVLVDDRQYTSSRLEDLTTFAKEAEREGELARFNICGTVINTGKWPTDGFHILAVGYDAEGKVVDVNDEYPEPSYLEPETSAPFQVSLHAVRPIADYEVFGEGPATEARELVELEVADFTVAGPDMQGETHFFGEVVNRGSKPATEIEVVMTLVNAEGQIRDVADTSYYFRAILVAPGEKLPFVISTSVPQEVWERPIFQVQGFTVDSLSEDYTGVYEDIKLEGLDTLERPYKRFESKGKVTNTGSSEADVSIAAIIYDAQGKIADVATTTIGMFKPGDSRDVKLIFEAAEEAPDFKVFYGALAKKE